eukprot:1194906-Prorocentrum_minimum.AAC.5
MCAKRVLSVSVSVQASKVELITEGSSRGAPVWRDAVDVGLFSDTFDPFITGDPGVPAHPHHPHRHSTGGGVRSPKALKP